MKKITLKVPVFLALVSLSLMTAYVSAESNKADETKSEDNKQQMEITRESNKQQNEIKREDNKNKQEMDQEDGDHNGLNDQEEMDNEGSLHDHFAQIPDIKTTVNIPPVDATKVNTYADIVTLLNQYRDTVNQIKIKGDITDFASSTLSTQEKAILSNITTKHSFELSRTNVRADELLSQIKDLTDILTPLGTQSISTELNLKSLLVSQLNDFTSTINSLTDLVDTTSTILDEETN